MAVTLVSGQTIGNSASFSTSVTATLPAPASAGNHIVVVAYLTSVTGLSIVDNVDTDGSEYSEFIGATEGAAQNVAFAEVVRAWIRPGIADSTTDAVTVSWTGNTFDAIYVFELTGDLDAPNYSDVNGIDGGFAATVSDTLTATNADSFGFMLVRKNNSAAVTPSGGASVQTDLGSKLFVLYEPGIGTSDSIGCTWTGATDISAWAFIIEAGAGGGGPSIPILTHHIRQQS